MECQYRCLACGGPITVRDGTEWDGADFTLTTVVEHSGPSDAACRLVTEVLRDDLARVRAAVVETVVRGLR